MKATLDDILPSISIKVPVKPFEFIDQMKQIGEVLQLPYTYDAEDYDTDNNLVILSFQMQDSSPHKQLCGQLIATAQMTTHINVEMRATKWHPEPPTYEAYSVAAQTFFEPLLTKYKEHYGRRVRLFIQSKADTEPKLPPQAQHFFDTFVKHANKTLLHPYDWERFYRFTRFCHTRRVKLSEADIERLLRREGFNNERARYIADIYRHCRDFLTAI